MLKLIIEFILWDDLDLGALGWCLLFSVVALTLEWSGAVAWLESLPW